MLGLGLFASPVPLGYAVSNLGGKESSLHMLVWILQRNPQKILYALSKSKPGSE